VHINVYFSTIIVDREIVQIRLTLNSVEMLVLSKHPSLLIAENSALFNVYRESFLNGCLNDVSVLFALQKTIVRKNNYIG